MANVVQFTIKGTDKFSGTFGKLNKTLGASINMSKTAAKAAAALGAASFGLALSIAKSQDATAKFASKLGATTEEMTKLHHAAELAGISTQTFNMASQRATRRIAEAAQGTGEAVKALDELGLSADELNRMPLDKKMETLSVALSGVENESDKVRLSFKLFDSEGVSMINMLGNGSEALRAAAADAEFLGIVLSQQAAADSEEFVNQFKRVGDAIKGFGMAIANKIIPFITHVMKITANWIAENRKSIVNFATTVTEVFFTAYYVIKDTLTGIGDLIFKIFTTDPITIWYTFVNNVVSVFKFMVETAMKTVPLILKVIWNTFKLAAEVMIGTMSWAWDNIKAIFTGESGISWSALLTERLPEATKEVRDELASAFSDYGTIGLESISAIGDAIGDTIGVSLESASEKARESMGSFAQAVVETSEKVQSSISDTGGLNPFSDEGIAKGSQNYKDALDDAYEKLSESLLSKNDLLSEQYTHEQDILTAALEAKLMSEEVYEQQLLELRQNYANQGLELYDTIQESIAAKAQEWLDNAQTLTQTYAELMMDSVSTVSAGMGKAFADTIVYGKNLSKSLETLAKSVIANVIKTLVQFGVQKLILSRLIKTTTTSDAASEGAKAVGLAGANMFASWAAAPWPISLGAPAAAMAAIVGASSALASGAAVGGSMGAGIIGAAASGMDYVPTTGTYVVHEGERILQPEQNKKLTEFLDSAGGGGAVVIENIAISVLPNATNADALLDMDSAIWNELVAGPIISALDLLNSKGVKPEFAS